MPESVPLLEMTGITKVYPGVTALDKVDFSLNRGEVHALVGGNGAGKSTLIKILMGIEKPDNGEVKLNGTVMRFESPQDAQRCGLATVFQELSQVPFLTIGENIFLGRERELGGGLMLNRKDIHRKARKLIEECGMDLDSRQTVSSLPMAKRQLAEIVKAVAIDPQLLVLDELTSSLTEDEAENLFRIIEKFKKKGVGIIYISHRMNELGRVADRITVLRDGCHVGTRPMHGLTIDEIVAMMVGQDTGLYKSTMQDSELKERRDKILEVRGLLQRGRFSDVSFDLYKGEVLGVAGLVGSGRSELMRILFGLDRADGGKILIDGKEVKIRNVWNAMANGLAMAPESRQLEGLSLMHTIEENLSLPSIMKLSPRCIVKQSARREFADGAIEKYAIKTDSRNKIVKQLSGGNQQKIVLAKWLATRPRILIVDEPMVGIDIRAKTEIHRIIRELADGGLAVIMISAEMPELIQNSDRIMVINDYKILAIDTGLDQNQIMTMIMQDKEKSKMEGVIR